MSLLTSNALALSQEWSEVATPGAPKTTRDV